MNDETFWLATIIIISFIFGITFGVILYTNSGASMVTIDNFCKYRNPNLEFDNVRGLLITNQGQLIIPCSNEKNTTNYYLDVVRKK